MCYKYIFAVILLVVAIAGNAQIGTSSRGLINLATIKIGKGSVIGKSSIPVCTPEGFACTPASLTYTFTGSGNWNVPENWLNNLIPPSSLTQGFEIMIAPEDSTGCILNVGQTIGPGAKLTILPGKNFSVAARVILKQ